MSASSRSKRVLADLVVFLLGTVVVLAAAAGVSIALGRPLAANTTAVVDVDLAVPANVSLPDLDERSAIYDGEGSLLAVIDREISRRTLPLNRIPRHMQHAVIATEDRKFYEHEGYDLEGIGRALVSNLQAGEIAEGGSTITQQLAKSEVGSDRTMQRKASELLYAIALEERFTKSELLERYLNQVYFGSRAYGIAAAAEEFFNTTAPNLRPHQSALLASLVRSPNSTDPRARPRQARKGRDVVLRSMAGEGYLTSGQLRRLLRRPLGVKQAARTFPRRQPHVIDAVERELLTLAELGPNTAERKRLLYYGGLRVTTTIDLQMQRTATDAIRAALPFGAPTAAIATVDPSSGAIKALASGLEYDQLEYDLASQGRRQPGSAFKPLVYAAALQAGYPLDISLPGQSPTYSEGVPGWERDCSSEDKQVCGVSNYGGASFKRVGMADALRDSVNTAAAQLTMTIGPRNVAKLAGRMGIDVDAATNGTVTASIGLGGLDQGVTPLEMAAAYAVFANEGKRVRPHLIAKVQDRSGRVLYETAQTETPVVHPAVNAAVVDMMRGVVEEGTGAAAQLPTWDVAGKTGTTSNNVDAWFVGYTPTLSTAVWVGHPEGQIEMPGMTGGSVPAALWQTYMSQVLNGEIPIPFPELDRAALTERVADRQVVAPDVVGMTDEDALDALGESRLIAEVRQVSSDEPTGTVVWQSPSAGGLLNVGDLVVIGASTGTGLSHPTGGDFPIYVPPPLLGYDDE